MEGGGFGRNAGPRGDYRGPLPDFCSAARAQGNHGRSSKPSLRRDAILGNGSQAHPTHKRSGALNAWKRTLPVLESQTERSHEPSEMNYQSLSKKSRSRSPRSDVNSNKRSGTWNVWKRTIPVHESQPERSHEPSEMSYQSLSKKSRSLSSRSDVNINTGRKQVANVDLILDDAGVELSRGNQLQSPMVGNQLSKRNQIQRSVLPQTSHQKEAAARKTGKHSDHKSVSSRLHGAVKSLAPPPDIRAERKKAFVHEALESLSVGPLLHTSVYTAPRNEKLDIDRAIRARLRKQEKSWSVLNTSELVSPIAAMQNPNGRCLCWKLLLSLPADPMDALPTKWLLTKFNLHERVSISISKTWHDPQLSLCFIRAEKTGPFVKKSVAGASSILFLLSGDTPLEVHKARLHNLCSHIPAHSYLPLLIVIGDHLNGEEETAIIDKLDLADIEQTKLKGISVIYLNQNPLSEFGSNGFLDDGRLREGVRWLAEHSPPQSEVSLVDTRVILLMYLKLKLEVLGDPCEVGPDQCIAAINESIDWLIRAIIGSASANPNFWPCPEIDLLEKFSYERDYAEMTLPRASWSEPQKVQAQTDVLIGCKLPCFGFDCPWLSEGSNYRDKKRIQDQKQGLEKYLFNYLKLYTGSHEAMAQSRNLVQKCTSLVLRDSSYYLVPKWTAIFRRIFNLRLISIPKYASDVYVSEEIANVDFFNVGWKDLLVSEELALVPLDEMIERCFVPHTVADVSSLALLLKLSF